MTIVLCNRTILGSIQGCCIIDRGVDVASATWQDSCGVDGSQYILGRWHDKVLKQTQGRAAGCTGCTRNFDPNKDKVILKKMIYLTMQY
jgi:hypothetical protein